MSRNGERKKITEIDANEACRTLAERCSALKGTEQWSTGQLVEFLEKFAEPGLIDEQLIYKWKRSGILVPIPESGKRHSDIYLFEQIRRAVLAAHMLEKRVESHSEIAGAVTFLGATGLNRMQEDAFRVFAEWERGWTWLASRFLSVIIGLAADTNGAPSDSIIMCRAMRKEDLQSPNELGLTLVAMEKRPELIPGQMVAGYATDRPEAEVIGRIRDFSDLVSKMEDKKYYGIQLRAPELLGSPYEIVVGVRPNATDNLSKRLFAAETPCPWPGDLTSASIILLCRVLNYISNILLDMPTRFKGNDPRYRLSSTDDHIDAMTTAIVMANDAWQSCEFFVREGDLLRLRSASPASSVRKDYTLPLNTQRNLESWVCESKDHIAIESLREGDPRIPFGDRELNTCPFAIVPALSKVKEAEGIVRINAQALRPSDDRVLESEIPFLQLLAGLLAEANARQRMTQIDHLLKVFPTVQEEYPAESDLFEMLIRLIEEHVAPQHNPFSSRSGVLTSEQLVLFAVQVESLGDPSVQDWYDKQICRRMAQFLESHITSRRYSKALNVSVYRLDRGKLVGLVKNMDYDSSFEDLRERLQRHLSAFSEIFQEVESHLWSRQFLYHVLRGQLLQHGSSLRSAIEEQASAIMVQTKRAIQDAKTLSEANDHLRNERFEQAVRCLKRTSGDDDPYVFRHLSEAYAGLKEWELAQQYAEKAIEADNKMHLEDYPGSHLRLAIALVGAKQYASGLREYENAAKRGREMRYQLALAEGLIRHGTSRDQFEKATSILRDLANRRDVMDQQKSWMYYLLAKAYEKLNDRTGIVDSMKSAVDADRKNLYARWELEAHQNGEVESKNLGLNPHQKASEHTAFRRPRNSKSPRRVE